MTCYHQIYQRFAIVGHSRTGSNYLVAGLRSSNCLKVHNEIFAGHSREIGKDFDLILSRVFLKEIGHIKAVGFKLFYYHLTEDEWKKFLSHKEIMIIHLTRENRLRTIVSRDIALKTDQWISFDNEIAPTAKKGVFLDTSRLIDRLEQIRDYEMLARDRFRDRPMLEVVYEDLVGKPREVFQCVGDFLGVDDIHPDEIALMRQNPESLEKLILNYEEVYGLLENTRFAEYLSSSRESLQADT